MLKSLLPASFLVFAGCSEQQASVAPEPPASEKAAPAAPAAGQASPAKARMIEEKNDLVEFTYGWPAEAAAIPALSARFQKELEELRRDALATAKEDKDSRTAENPFNGHYLNKVWTLEGNSPRLLSLAAEVGSFTGGAHGNVVYNTVLWDRKAGRPIEVAALFTDAAAAFKAMTSFYCTELDKQRAEKRGEPLPLQGEDDWMTQCRPLAEQTVAPTDTNKDGKFDLLRVMIEPYNSGPYAEGIYEVDIPVTPAIRALVKKDYASSF